MLPLLKRQVFGYQMHRPGDSDPLPTRSPNPALSLQSLHLHPPSTASHLLYLQPQSLSRPPQDLFPPPSRLNLRVSSEREHLPRHPKSEIVFHVCMFFEHLCSKYLCLSIYVLHGNLKTFSNGILYLFMRLSV